MANKRLFGTSIRAKAPIANTVNLAGGKAYSLTSAEALAQIAVSGTFNNYFYVSGDKLLEQVKTLCDTVDSTTIAKVALYAAQEGRKDMPAYLLAQLTARGETELVKKIFPRIITSIKMLLNYVQIIRSGATGRRSFGTAIKRLILNWIDSRTDAQLFRNSFGHSQPSLCDVVKMVHPRPQTPERAALYAYLIGKNVDSAALPECVQEYMAFKENSAGKVPNVPFQALSNLTLTAKQWREVGLNMPWNTLRMNLNQLAKNGAFEDKKFVGTVADKLKDPSLVTAMPYEIMTAIHNLNNVPQAVNNALHDALEASVNNVPDLGDVVICIDVSGSMTSPINGMGPKTSNTTCAHVAAMIGAVLARKNRNAEVLGWDTNVYKLPLNPNDSVMTNVQKCRFNGGGTDSSCALKYLNSTSAKHDLVLYISDNQSWYGSSYGCTGMAAEWQNYRQRNKKAKLACINIQPYGNTQVPDGLGVINIGGFNDEVFNVLRRFTTGYKGSFVDHINETVEL